MADKQDIVEVLTKDHREVEEMFAQFEVTTDADELRDIRDQVTTELIRHSAAEEQYLYPAVREHVPGGDSLADKEIEDHNKVEAALKSLGKMDTEDPNFVHTFRQMSNEVRAHIKEEEADLFPQLQEHTTPDQLRELGGKIQSAKKLAPTRPHPSTPDTPPLNKVLGAGAGLVDRIRDKLTHRGS